MCETAHRELKKNKLFKIQLHFLLTDKIPNGGNCDFETDWCGWKNSGTAMMLWERHTGPTPTDKTGPGGC